MNLLSLVALLSSLSWAQVGTLLNGGTAVGGAVADSTQTSNTLYWGVPPTISSGSSNGSLTLDPGATFIATGPVYVSNIIPPTTHQSSVTVNGGVLIGGNNNFTLNNSTKNGVMYGGGTAAMGMTAAMGNGGLVIGAGTGSIPSTGTLSGIGGLTITNGAGSIQISTSGSIADVNAYKIWGATQSFLGSGGQEASSCAGCMGESTSNVRAVNQTPGASGTFVDLATITVTAGRWLIFSLGEIADGATTSATDTTFGISSTANGIDSGVGSPINRCRFGVTQLANGTDSCNMMRIVNITATTTYYLTGSLTYSVLGGALFTTNNAIQAIRFP